ncbi:MAG: helix-turn-helix transcriptional regulator [Candidatus Moraniibacteriota bacterium]
MMSITTKRKEFGSRLRELRKKAGFSQEELGFKAGLHRTYIGSIERGEQNISVDNINKLAKALKISAKEFFE